MKILTTENKSYNLNKVPELVDDLQYCVLDTTNKNNIDFFFIPLILILPRFYDEFGVWISFALADVLSTIVTAYFLNREVQRTLIV